MRVPSTMSRNIGIIPAIISMLLFQPLHADAWGKEGHEIVAKVAMQYLSAPAKTQVLKILRNIKPADAGNWMDDMRANDYYSFMRHWHYVDIPKDSSYTPGQGDNLIAALNHVFNDLKKGNPNREHKQEDVLVIFHLIGDMHQPLHTGYPDDKGGNSVQVRFGGGNTNLHAVWDYEIIDDQKITLDSVLQLARSLDNEKLKAIRSGSFVNWMYESRSHLPQVYNFTGNKLDDAYVQRNKLLVEQQLLFAGIRLAHVLNTLFGDVDQKS